MLEAIRAIEVDRAARGVPYVDVPHTSMIAEHSDLPLSDVKASVRDLLEAYPAYITASDASDVTEWDVMGIRLTERGRRAVGQWPGGDAYDSLLEVLDSHIEAETEPDQRAALEKFRDGALQVTREVGVSLLTAWMKSQTGL